MNIFKTTPSSPAVVTTYPELEARLPAAISPELWEEASQAPEVANADPLDRELIRDVVYAIAADHISRVHYAGVKISDLPPIYATVADDGDLDPQFQQLSRSLAARRPLGYYRDAMLERKRELAERGERTTALTNEIMSDPARRLAVYRHALTGPVATRLRDERNEAAREAARLKAEFECPLCGGISGGETGEVKLRALLPGGPLVSNDPTVPHLRSCGACWNVRSALEVTRLGAQLVNGSKETRAEAVARHASNTYSAGSL